MCVGGRYFWVYECVCMRRAHMHAHTHVKGRVGYCMSSSLVLCFAF